MGYICIYLFSSILFIVVERININYLKERGQKIPVPFQDVVHEKEFKKIIQYTSEQVQFKIFQTIVTKALFLFIIISGILPWFNEKLANTNFLSAGLIFFALIGLAEFLIGLPFEFYHSFIIEDRYGFNTKTVKIWISDILKSLLVMVVLGGMLLSALLLILKYAQWYWWVWAWFIFTSFQLIMVFLYPRFIAPLFNRFTQLESRELKSAIQRLAKRENMSIQEIYQMDATQRTRHTNAYLSGLGKTKRIVLFDSLIQSYKQDEILAIIAHEIGHFKKKHIKKQLIITGFASLFLFFFASKLIACNVMYKSFGFSDTPYYVGLFLVGILWAPANFLLSPIGMAVSRKFEREADYYSLKILGTEKPLSNALKKMAKDNLSNLIPHPIYVFFNYSHPPLVERIRYLKAYERSLHQGENQQKGMIPRSL